MENIKEVFSDQELVMLIQAAVDHTNQRHQWAGEMAQKGYLMRSGREPTIEDINEAIDSCKVADGIVGKLRHLREVAYGEKPG